MNSSVRRIAVLSIAALAFALAVVALNWLSSNRIPNFEGEAEVYVYPDTTPEQVIEQIRQQTTIRSEKSLLKTFADHSVAKHITPGHYTVRADYTSVYVARMLNNGWQSPIKVTLSGSLRLKSEIARKLSSQLLLDYDTAKAALDDEKLLAKFGFTPATVYALFVPDTYEMYWTWGVEEVLARMKKAYDAYWTADRTAKAKSLGFSKMDVAILASIVSCESNYEPEYPQLAGVYINRLRKHMRLQACPTVAFIYGFTLNRVLQSHIATDSPYNTYKNDGLPPGPICCPSRAALEAVLNADTASGYLYFCANSDFSGTHKFAKSYSEHSRNAAAFQREYDRRHAERLAAEQLESGR